jgi:hypothetical protein
MNQDRNRLMQVWTNERQLAKDAVAQGDRVKAWAHLERAHIVSQPMVLLHVRTHMAMLSFAVRHRDGHEIAGQLFRLVVAGPGSLTGRYPVGNTGGANVSAFMVMDIPDDLQPLLSPRV